jgi:hypothetical protein
VHAFPFENDTTLHSDQFAVWNGNFKLISIWRKLYLILPRLNITGTDFLFQESSWTLITYLKALYR